MFRRHYFFIFTILFICVSLSGQALEKRTSFDIPLSKLSILNDTLTGREGARISINGSIEYALIFPITDYLIKNNSDGRVTTVYQEGLDRAFVISDFEATQLNRVTNGLVETLTRLEIDIGKKRWDRCLYLDSFLPRFLRCYYALYNASRDYNCIPEIACVPDSAYDISLNSPKSDARINSWKVSDAQQLKIRIAVKEFIEQAQIWQKKELANPKRNPLVSSGELFEKKFTVFVRSYFNRI